MWRLLDYPVLSGLSKGLAQMTPVWEDPDELGYWSGGSFDRGDATPPWLRDFQRDIEQMRLPEFFPTGYTQRVCDTLLSEQEQRTIQECARLMHAGRDFDAERNRAYAGYDFTFRKADRIVRSLPIGEL